MGDYTNAIELRKLYKKIDTTGLVDNDLDFFILQAESEIDGYIVTRYDLPFSSVPPLVKTMATELSLIKVLDRYFTSETKSKNDWRSIRKKDLLDLLDKVAKGETALVDSSKVIISQRTDIHDIHSDTKDYTPTFSHLGVTLQEIDPDRLDDEEDALDD